MEGMIANIMESFPGFKFHPSDVELLVQHLKPKIEGTLVEDSRVVPELEVCQFDPWQLPKIFNDLSLWKSQEGAKEWVFFCPRKRKYSNGRQSERRTHSGYWKITGVDRAIKTEDGVSVGVKKTLVFYRGRFPNGKRTNWVMHECHLSASCLTDDLHGDQLPFVACRLKLKKDKKGLTTEDYPAEDSTNNSPCTHPSKGYSSSCSSTPNSTTPEHRQATVDPHSAAYQNEVSLADFYGSLPNLQRLDIDATSDYGYMLPSPPQQFSPWNTYDDNSCLGWDHSYGSSN